MQKAGLEENSQAWVDSCKSSLGAGDWSFPNSFLKGGHWELNCLHKGHGSPKLSSCPLASNEAVITFFPSLPYRKTLRYWGTLVKD